MSRTLPKVTPLKSSAARTLAELGLHVRNQRASSRLRIDDAAALCMVSSAVLSRLENGRPVTSDKLMLVLQGLGLQLHITSSGEAIVHSESLRDE